MKYVESRLRQKANELSEAETDWDHLEESQKDAWEARRALRYAKIHITGLLGWVVKRKYGQHSPEVAGKLLGVIGDFSAPHDTAKRLIDFATSVVEDFALGEIRHNKEEYDAAILFRRADTWKELKSTAELRYDREKIALVLP